MDTMDSDLNQLELEVHDILNLGPEDDNGNIEYKRMIVDKDDQRLDELATQMRYRLKEGNGECIYIIGIDDNGDPYGLTNEEFDESSKNLQKIADRNDYSLRHLQTTIYKKTKKIGEFLVRENNVIQCKDIRIAVAGRVDAGKSSFIGTLISGDLDDGRGRARTKVFNFKHEIETGRTSSISQQILGYDPEGNVVNHDNLIKKLSWPEITARSSKIINFFDLCGHTKYSKTTIAGLSSNAIDYTVIIVGANMGISQKDSTIEHIKLCLTYRIPMIVIITKIDLCDNRDSLEHTIATVKKIFRLPGARKNTVKIQNMTDVITVSKSISNGDLVPIFEVSNVTGHGLNLVHEFFNLLEPRLTFDTDKPVEYYIDTTYNVSGIGTVVGGFLLNGTLKLNKMYYLGPSKIGEFIPVKIRSLHVKRTLVQEANSGRYVCASIPKIKREDILRGMAIIEYNPQKHGKKILPINKFAAEIIVRESHHTSIKIGYQVTLTINTLRTTVQLTKINKVDKVNLKISGEHLTDSSEDLKKVPQTQTKLAQGDRAFVEFELIFQPGYFNINDRIVLSEGNVRMVGRVTEIFTN